MDVLYSAAPGDTVTPRFEVSGFDLYDQLVTATTRPVLIQAAPLEDTCTLTLGCDIARTMLTLGQCLMELGRYAEAEPLLLEGFDRIRAVKGDRDRYNREVLEHLTGLYDAWDKPDQATQYRALLQSE